MTTANTNDITANPSVYIRELQQYLRTIELYTTGSTLVPVDGVYGSRTTTAVREFQRGAGLPITGVVDRATWDAIYLAYLEIVAANALATPIQGYQNPSLSLGVGDRGDGVAFLQIMLRRLAMRYQNIPAEPIISGLYTPATARAVAAMQGIAGLEETGQTDKATWNAITTLYNTNTTVG